MEGDEEILGGDLDMGEAVNSIAEGLGFTPSDDPSDGDDGLGDGETVNEEVATPATDPAETPPAEGEATPASDPLATPPRTWRPEAIADWDKVPPAARAEILKREEDMFKGLEAYKADASIGKAFKQSVSKYAPILQQYNIDPMQQVAGLMDAHYTLATGSAEQKLALFQRLAQDYNINLAEAAVAQPPYVDPQVERLQKELDSVKSTITAEQQRAAAQARASFEAEVAKFEADPANLYFKELSNDMATLLEKGIASNLREAYDKALRLNPIVYAKDQQRQQAEAAKKASEEAARKAAAARKATSANVRSSAKAGSAAAPLGSIDDTLDAAYKEIMSRQ